MDTLMSGAMMIETVLASFLLGVWIAWIGLSGLFRVMPVTGGSTTRSQGGCNTRESD